MAIFASAMRLLAVLFIALAGLVSGVLASFIFAIVVRPEDSADYMFRGSFVGMFALLWLTGSFGRLMIGAVWGLLGAVVGWTVGWILDHTVFHAGESASQWCTFPGAVLFSIRRPCTEKDWSVKVEVRGWNLGRQSARDSGGFQMPIPTWTGTPMIPGYRNNGMLLGTQLLQSELSNLALGIGFGEARSVDNSAVASDLNFYAVDREWVETEFYRYLAQRMDADGIREWTEAKFRLRRFRLVLEHLRQLICCSQPLRDRLRSARYARHCSTPRRGWEGAVRELITESFLHWEK